MSKLSLTDIATFGSSAITALNANNALVETALENTLSRDGTSPNQMGADLDMNSYYILNMNDLDMNGHRIINLPSPSVNSEPLRLGDITQLLDVDVLAVSLTATYLPKYSGAALVDSSLSETSTEIGSSKSFIITKSSGTSYALGTSQTVSGTSTGDHIYSNIINIVDNADHHLNTIGGNNGFYVQYATSGGLGGRTAGYFNLSMTGATTGANEDSTALGAHSFTSVNNGGTGITPRGSYFGANFAAGTTSASATFLSSVIGVEVNTSVVTSSSTTSKIGLQIVQSATDKVSGTTLDTALRFANQALAVGWDNGIVFDNLVQQPVKNTGTLIKTIGAWTVATGLDFSSLTISGNFLAGPSFSVTGAGVVTGASYKIGSVTVLQIVTNYTQVLDQAGRAALTLGNATDPTGYYDNTTHVFRNRATTASFVTINSNGLAIHGSTSGSITIKPPAIAGSNTLTLPAGNTDFSATGGTGHFVKQASVGAALTTSAPIISELGGLGTNVATALAVNIGSAGAFVTFNGALGTPSSGTVTNLTGTASININGTVGATTPNTGVFTTVSASTSVTAPLHIGGSGTTGTQLTFKTTTGVGATETISFLGGNNGANTWSTWRSDATSSAFTFFGRASDSQLNIDGSGSFTSINYYSSGGLQAQTYVQPGAGTPTFAFNVAGTYQVLFQIGASTKLTLQNSGGLSIGVATDPGAGGLYVNTGLGIGTNVTSTSFLTLAAGTTAKSALRFVQGAAPTSPVDGDMWREDNTNTGLKVRINGVTKTVTVA